MFGKQFNITDQQRQDVIFLDSQRKQINFNYPEFSVTEGEWWADQRPEDLIGTKIQLPQKNQRKKKRNPALTKKIDDDFVKSWGNKVTLSERTLQHFYSFYQQTVPE